MKNSFTTYVADLEKNCIVVRHVPCMKCDQCGEIVYTGAVMATLERLIDTLKGALAEVAVVSFPDAAA